MLLQLPDRGLQLRNRGADVRQLDDVGLGRLGQLAELGEVVGLPPLGRQMLGKAGEDAAGQRDVSRLDDDAGGAGERLNDRQQRVGGERRGFVGVGVDDLGWS